MINYPIVLHKDKGSDYGVIVPDLPGCFSAGSSIDEALAMARQAIQLHLEGLVEEGQRIPRPGRIERHQKNPDYEGGFWAVVTVESPAARGHSGTKRTSPPARQPRKNGAKSTSRKSATGRSPGRAAKRAG
jgi:predicted RNase H-like HicB family nuclease